MKSEQEFREGPRTGLARFLMRIPVPVFMLTGTLTGLVFAELTKPYVLPVLTKLICPLLPFLPLCSGR